MFLLVILVLLKGGGLAPGLGPVPQEKTPQQSWGTGPSPGGRGWQKAYWYCYTTINSSARVLLLLVRIEYYLVFLQGYHDEAHDHHNTIITVSL